MGTSISFLGAARTVTGSRHLIMHNNKNILVDCGLFQGLKELRRRNWDEFDMPAHKIDYIILTHAHIDHSGYIPKLVQQGFKGKIFATEITRKLCDILLKDSAYLQEEEARYANKKGYTKHSPAEPLYRLEDAVESMKYFKTVERNHFVDIAPGIRFRFRNAGHILGSSIVEIWLDGYGDRIKLAFSGDLGRLKSVILKDPDTIREADYLILESTYGDRLHPPANPEEELEPIVNRMIENRSCLLIPAFAVERTQEVIYHLRSLMSKGRIPEIPIYIDSPMAISVTRLFNEHTEIFDKETRDLMDREGRSVFEAPNIHFTPTQRDSKSLNDKSGPMIIISASGMATGGRVLHHLKERLPYEKNIVLMVGYQAEGTRGRTLVEGAKSLKIHGQYIPVRAQVETVSSFSAHADYNEILTWLKGLGDYKPRRVFLVHGEDSSLISMKQKIETNFNWRCIIPDHLDKFPLRSREPFPDKQNAEVF